MELVELYTLVTDFYGAKATDAAFNSVNKTVTCVLYETFPCSFNTNDRHGALFGGVILADGSVQGKLLGTTPSLNSDHATMTERLDLIDRWCRLQLTDKFLAAFDKAYLSGPREPS